MYYSELAHIYAELEKTAKRLAKIDIISNFLKKCSEEDLNRVIYLIQGRVFPHYDERKYVIENVLGGIISPFKSEDEARMEVSYIKNGKIFLEINEDAMK